MKRRKITCYLALLIAFCIASCKKESPVTIHVQLPPVITSQSFTTDEITAFTQMTFDATGLITRWPGQVTFFLVDTSYPYMIRNLDSIVHELNLLLDTTLMITRTEDKSIPAVKIYLRNRDSYLLAEPSSAASPPSYDYIGLAHYYWGDQHDISPGDATAFVDMERTAGDTARQYSVLHHEIMHILGFYGHEYQSNVYSVLFYPTQTVAVQDYTDFDKRVIKLLYSSSLYPGMSRDEFNKVIQGL